MSRSSSRLGGWAAAALWMALPAAVSAQTPVGVLDTLQVTVSSRVSPGLSARTRTVQVMTRDQIEALPARSLGDLLRWMNGVELQQRSGAQADLSLRGAGFEQVLVLVDGMRVSDSQSGHFDLDVAVPLDRIQRIEVLRGPASALFGADAVGGVVNIVTSAGDATSGAAARMTGRAEGGSFGTARLSSTQSLPLGQAALTLGEEWATSDGDRPGTDYENLVLQGTLGAPLGGGVLELSGGHASRDFGASDFYAPIPSYEETRTNRVVGGWTSGDLGSIRVRARASLRDHHDEFVFFRDEPSRGANVHDSRQWGGELVFRGGEGSDASFALGAEGWRDELESTNLGSRAESRGAVFGEAVLRLAEDGVVTLGARADGHEEYGGFFSPSIAAAWDVSGSVRLKGSAARSFRAPTWTERYYADPFHQASAGIDAEEAWAYEAGIELEAARWSVRATGFRRDTENLIDWAKPNGSGEDVKWVTRNVVQADFTGLELDVTGVAPWDVTWEAGASFLDVEPTGDAGYFSKRALRPETRRLALSASRPLGETVGLALHGLWAGRRSEGAYHQIDLRLWARLASGTLYADVVNLTDEDYLDASGQPVPGLGLLVGYRLGR